MLRNHKCHPPNTHLFWHPITRPNFCHLGGKFIFIIDPVRVFWHVKWQFWDRNLKWKINSSSTVIYVSGQLDGALLSIIFWHKSGPIELKIFLQHLQTMLYNFYLRSFCVRCQVSKLWGVKDFLWKNFFKLHPHPQNLR